MPVVTLALSPMPTAPRSDSKICAITQTWERSATVKAAVVPACRSWPGVISRSTTVPAMGERIRPSMRASGFPARMSLMVPAIDIQRRQSLKGGVAIGFGIGGVGLGLFGLALGDALMQHQVLVGIGDTAGIGARWRPPF